MAYLTAMLLVRLVWKIHRNEN